MPASWPSSTEDGVPAIERAAELASEVMRLFLRKLPDQLRIGLAIATATRHPMLCHRVAGPSDRRGGSRGAHPR